MKRSILVSFFAVVALMASAAHADVIYDLPNLEEGASLPPTPPPQSPSEPRVPAPVDKPRELHVGKEVIKNIPIKKGGTLYRIDLSKALPLTNIDVKILKGNLKIREGALITTQGDRIAIREFKDVQVLPPGSKLFSENLNVTTPIKAIEIRSESFLESADLQVEATSDIQEPVLRLRVVASSPIHLGDEVFFSQEGIISFVGNAKVLEMLDSRNVRVQFEKLKTPTIVSLSSLRKTVNCVEKGNDLTVCKGDRVTYNGNFKYSASVYAVLGRDKIMIILDDKYKNLISVSLDLISK